jgi:hypothetical protein
VLDAIAMIVARVRVLARRKDVIVRRRKNRVVGDAARGEGSERNRVGELPCSFPRSYRDRESALVLVAA